MRLIIHDLPEADARTIAGAAEGDRFLYADPAFHNCIGCFGCWLKTPGECVLKDGLECMGRLISEADEVIVISRYVYGWLSPECKCVIDRSICYIQPFFRLIGGEMHHKPRYAHRYKISFLFYGDSAEDERELTKTLADRVALNLYASVKGVYVADTWQELGGARI